MSTWDEKAKRVVDAENPGGFYLNAGFVYGARWQRVALLSSNTVKRVARALNHEGWTCWWCEPDEYDQCGRCGATCDHMACTALTAAIGDDDE